MKFPALYSSFESLEPGMAKILRGFNEMESSQINSVKVYLKDIGYQSDLNAIDVYCHELKMSWGEASITKFSQLSYAMQPLDIQNVSYSNGLQQSPVNTYSFDITNLAKSWLDSNFYTIKYGIMFKASDTVENGTNSLCCYFGSYNSMYYAPYLVIDYTIPYDYQCTTDVPVSYTFKKDFYLNAGQQYIFKTGKATDFGEADTELYLFKSDMAPGDASWFNDDSNGKYSKIEATIQEEGYYTLMAKYYTPTGRGGVANTGYCNVYQVNPQTQAETLIAENAQLGGYIMILPQNISYTNSLYNSFTANVTGCDTLMYILSENTLNNKRVIGYNDDYHGEGDFNWRTASRVQQTYDNNNKPRYVYVTSFSHSATGTADIYALCKGLYSSSSFPNLESDDAIISAPGTYAYNCIAYSGGLTNEWITPQLNLMSGLLTPWYNQDNETALDNYYGNNPPRYVGAMTYEVTSNPTEAVINVYKKGDSWTHASVRKPANNQTHGYAWESKLGNSVRVFHDINSLDSDNGYGHVERRYKIADDVRSMTSYGSGEYDVNEITFEESVKLGLTEVQKVDFTIDEINKINKEVESISESEKEIFGVLIDEWQEKILNDSKLSIVSDPALFIETDEYIKLSEYIDQNDELLYYLIDIFINGDNDVFITLLFNDKVVSKNENTIAIANAVRNENNSISINSLKSDDVEKSSLLTKNVQSDVAYIAPTYRTNALCFIKEVLNNKTGDILKQ